MSEQDDSYAASERADRTPLDQRSRSSFWVQERVSSRFSMPSQITVSAVKTYPKLHEIPPRFWVTTRDVSASGISFLCKHRLYYGEQVRVELRMDGGDLREVAARIVRCYRRDDVFEVGAAFEKAGAALPPAEPKAAQLDGADM